MPIYEFACQDCDRRFEELVKVNGAAVAVTCPQCGSTDAQRLLSMFAVGSASHSKPDWSAATGNGGGCCGGACGCH
jgi:putative FmdB family regulatory protein